MNRLPRWFAALTVLVGSVATASAQPFGPQPYYCPPPCYARAPDACCPQNGSFTANKCGTIYGPNFYLRPCFPPYQGPRPDQCVPQRQPEFVTHPYARSPRDFFMLDLN